MTKYKLGIALGGGGARGFAHLGVMQALKERGYEPDIISGTSAGAIAGVFLADGKSPEAIYKDLKEKGFFKYSRLNIPKMGLAGLEGLEEQLEHDLSVSQLEDLPTHFIVAATNLNTGKVEYLQKGPVEKIIKASSSIPILFSPVEIDGSLYADGGILNNVPVEPLRELCEKTIGVNIIPITERQEIDNLFQVALRSFQLSVSGTVKDLHERCDLVIALEKCSQYDLLNTNQAEELFNIGYEHVMAMDLSVLEQ